MFLFLNYVKLAEGPGVARGKKKIFKKIYCKKIGKKLEKNSNFFSLYNSPRPPMSVHNKFQPNRSSRVACYRQHIIHIRMSCFFI